MIHLEINQILSPDFENPNDYFKSRRGRDLGYYLIMGISLPVLALTSFHELASPSSSEDSLSSPVRSSEMTSNSSGRSVERTSDVTSAVSSSTKFFAYK